MEDYLTPVSIIIYNRPEITEKLIQRLAIVKPQIIYVIADGHKDIYTDKELVLKTRKIVNQINWKCQLTKIYSDINMGLKNRIITGLSQVFSEVEKTIILEDDCIPSRSFFNFCSEILEKYESNNNIMVVSGTNEFSYDLKIDYESNYFFLELLQLGAGPLGEGFGWTLKK